MDQRVSFPGLWRRRAMIAASLVCVFAPHWASAQLSFSNVVDTTAVAPGQTTFGAFGTPVLSGSSVGFYGAFGSGNGQGLYTAVVGQPGISKLADIYDTAPEGGTYTGFGGVGLDGTTVSFSSGYTLPQPGQYGVGVYIGSVGVTGATKVFDSNDVAPGHGNFITLSALSLSKGKFALSGGFSGGYGLYTGTLGNSGLTTIADTSTIAPGHGVFTSIGGGVLSGDNLLVSGAFSGGSGIYSGTFGTAGVTEIVDNSTIAPGHGTFTTFSSLSLSGSNLAFHGLYSGGDGVYTGTVGVAGASRVADTTTVVPIDGQLLEFEGVSISGNNVAFTAYYNGGKGLFFESGGQIIPVLSHGDSLFGSTVSTVGLSSQGLDGNNIAFSYALADGRRGVGVVTVPEPGVGMLVFAGLFLVHGRRRRCIL